MGEPAGIGPEVAVAAFKALGGRAAGIRCGWWAIRDVFRACGMTDDAALIPTSTKATRVAGKPDSANARAVTEAIELFRRAGGAGPRRRASSPRPINKAVLAAAGFGFPGHTEFLAHLTGAKRAVMMLASDALRVVPLTIHIPVAEVPRAITTESIIETGEIVLAALSAISASRIRGWRSRD